MIILLPGVREAYMSHLVLFQLCKVRESMICLEQVKTIDLLTLTEVHASFRTSLGFTRAPLLSQDPIQEISLHLFAFPEALFGCERFSDFLIFDDHKGFEKYWSGNVPQLGFVWCFSHDEARVMDLGEDIHRGKVSFSSSPMRNKSYHGSCNTSSPCPLSPCLLAPVTLGTCHS